MPVIPIERRTVSEPELIARILRGQRHLFHELVRPYERAVYVTAYAVLRSRENAEEAAQETMLKALMHLDQLADPAKFKPWLLHIALNEARLKRRREHASFFEPLDNGSGEDEGMFMPRDFADWREIPLETLERKEVRQAVANALQKLPEIYREIFILRDVEELSVSDCCALLGVSEEVVKVRLHRARLRIREELAPIFKATWLRRAFSFKGKRPW